MIDKLNEKRRKPTPSFRNSSKFSNKEYCRSPILKNPYNFEIPNDYYTYHQKFHVYALKNREQQRDINNFKNYHRIRKTNYEREDNNENKIPFYPESNNSYTVKNNSPYYDNDNRYKNIPEYYNNRNYSSPYYMNTEYNQDYYPVYLSELNETPSDFYNYQNNKFNRNLGQNNNFPQRYLYNYDEYNTRNNNEKINNERNNLDMNNFQNNFAEHFRNMNQYQNNYFNPYSNNSNTNHIYNYQHNDYVPTKNYPYNDNNNNEKRNKYMENEYFDKIDLEQNVNYKIDTSLLDENEENKNNDYDITVIKNKNILTNGIETECMNEINKSNINNKYEYVDEKNTYKIHERVVSRLISDESSYGGENFYKSSLSNMEINKNENISNLDISEDVIKDSNHIINRYSSLPQHQKLNEFQNDNILYQTSKLNSLLNINKKFSHNNTPSNKDNFDNNDIYYSISNVNSSIDNNSKNSYNTPNIDINKNINNNYSHNNTPSNKDNFDNNDIYYPISNVNCSVDINNNSHNTPNININKNINNIKKINNTLKTNEIINNTEHHPQNLNMEKPLLLNSFSTSTKINDIDKYVDVDDSKINEKVEKNNVDDSKINEKIEKNDVDDLKINEKVEKNDVDDLKINEKIEKNDVDDLKINEKVEKNDVDDKKEKNNDDEKNENKNDEELETPELDMSNDNLSMNDELINKLGIMENEHSQNSNIKNNDILINENNNQYLNDNIINNINSTLNDFEIKESNDDNKNEDFGNKLHIKKHKNKSPKFKLTSEKYDTHNDEETSMEINEASLDNSYYELETEKIGKENKNDSIPQVPIQQKFINDLTISEITTTEPLHLNDNHKYNKSLPNNNDGNINIKPNKNNSLLYKLDSNKNSKTFNLKKENEPINLNNNEGINQNDVNSNIQEKDSSRLLQKKRQEKLLKEDNQQNILNAFTKVNEFKNKIITKKLILNVEEEENMMNILNQNEKPIASPDILINKELSEIIESPIPFEEECHKIHEEVIKTNENIQKDMPLKINISNLKKIELSSEEKDFIPIVLFKTYFADTYGNYDNISIFNSFSEKEKDDNNNLFMTETTSTNLLNEFLRLEGKENLKIEIEKIKPITFEEALLKNYTEYVINRTTYDIIKKQLPESLQILHKYIKHYYNEIQDYLISIPIDNIQIWIKIPNISKFVYFNFLSQK
ncbi:hypothetical protein PIROE2DRAFT_59526 [Piromyces sp. E2]|nr:hypothetical protein PIROE2DRAFT_59526 [Piromyces sp. E2]|eukprot:OUM66208.1 hypothetical protein PIROE2DRAFT_59526 [Piromyces sp. E2]